MTTPVWLAIIAALILIALWLAPVSFTEPPEIKARVSYVVDGDSLYLDGHKPQLRLWGVDAPERGQTGYRATTDTLFNIAHGQPVTCRPVDKDRYGRDVARCFLPDGREINRMMIESRTAREYLPFSKGFYSRD